MLSRLKLRESEALKKQFKASLIVIHPLPKRLKEARLAVGLSQKGLGIKAGIDASSASPRMNQYETGKHTPDFSTCVKLCEALNVPVAYLYAESDELAGVIKAFHCLSK